MVEHYVQSTTAEDSTALHASNAKLLYNFAKVLNHLDTTLARLACPPSFPYHPGHR